jgi:hypothetical protein
LELYDSGIDQPLKIIAIPNQGADPRIRILAGMILNYILDQQPYLDLNTARELSALLPYCTVLLQNPPVILTGEAELTTGDKCWFRINLSKVEDSLRYYSGDLAATTIISDLLQRSNLAPDDVVVLLATEQIQTPYFSERLLKQYRHVQRIMPLHHDGAMELVFRKTVQRTETINNKTAQINPTIQRNPITAANPVIPNNPTTTTSARQAMPERPKCRRPCLRNRHRDRPSYHRPYRPPKRRPGRPGSSSNHHINRRPRHQCHHLRKKINRQTLTIKPMAIQLQKKVPVSLIKVDSGLQKIIAGLGWDPATENGHPVDLDLSLFMMGANGKLLSEEYFIFYNNPFSPDGSAFYPGDSRAGEGEGDDEVIRLDLNRADPGAEFLYFAVTIDQSEERGHQFRAREKRLYPHPERRYPNRTLRIPAE